MNGFAKLTKETWKFYLIVLVVSLVCVISDALYLCGEMKFQYKDDNSSFYPDGKVFSDLIVDKATGYDLLGFFTIIVGIIIVLGFRHFAFMEQRGKEFQVFLPVKQRTIVMHDFLCMTGIILLSFLTMTGMFLTAQTKYNKDMLKAAQEHHIEGMKENLVALANEEMLKYIACYFLFVLFMFALIYLGMLVCKNCMVGMLITLSIWRLSIFFLDEISWLLGCYYADNLGISTRDAEQKSLIQMVDNLQTVINPDKFFGGYWGNRITISTSILIIAGFTILILLLIVLAAGKIEVSKGKLFYFSFLDYFFAALCGLGISYYLYGFAENVLFAVVTGFLAAGLVWWFVHPGKQKVLNEWEVK